MLFLRHVLRFDVLLSVESIVDTESVIACSDATLNVSEKMRKKKVETYSEARFCCPIEDCKQKSTVHRYRTLFDHFADCCKPDGYERF